MKKKLHPEYKNCIVTCACGSTFETRSTLEKIHIEICSQCHPFYTGKQKLVDSAGRVELFHRRYRNAAKKSQAVESKETAREKQAAEDKAEPVAAAGKAKASGDGKQAPEKA